MSLSPIHIPFHLDGQSGAVIVTASETSEPISSRLTSVLVELVISQTASITLLPNPQHPPWQVPHRLLFHDVPCKYCYKSICPEGHHPCLRQVLPDTIVAATCELLNESARSPLIFQSSTPLLSTKVIWDLTAGEVAEWSIASDLKSDEPKGSEGSNPSLSVELGCRCHSVYKAILANGLIKVKRKTSQTTHQNSFKNTRVS